MEQNQIQFRKDNTTNWESYNPILSSGEPGYNISRKELKIGDGSTAWNDLLYINENLMAPVGSIVARIDGYFDDSSNGNYTNKNLSLPDNWKVCNGDPCNDSNSLIFNGSGRYLPTLSDERFIMGDTEPGLSGGNNNMNDHKHSCGSRSDDHIHTIDGGSHSHVIKADYHAASGSTISDPRYLSDQGRGFTYTMYDDGHSHNCAIGSSHVHSIDSSYPSPSFIDNRPIYLTCTYIIRIK